VPMKRGPAPLEEIKYRLQDLETGEWFTDVGDFFDSQQAVSDRMSMFVDNTKIKLPRLRMWKVFVTPAARVPTAIEGGM